MNRPGMMKLEVTAKGGKGSKKAVIDEALDEIRKIVDATDLRSIEDRRAPPPEDETETDMSTSSEECEACKNGTCDDPDHNEDALSELMTGADG